MPFAWVVFALVALLATLSVTEMVRIFAHRLSAVDRPGGRRVHRRPTARLGGLGIFWGFYVSLALATYGNPFWSEMFHGDDLGLIGMMIASCMLLIVGVMDDVYGLRPTAKVVFQVGAALILYRFGWRAESLGLPGFGSLPLEALSLPVTVMWVLLVTNAVNLIDGLDGLAGGLALVATIAIGLMVGSEGGPLLLVAAALAGALVGFLWFNLNPALIFMGDAGSLFVGFVLSAMTLRVGHLSPPEFFPLIPVLLLVVPLFDTADAIWRRTWATARASRSATQFMREVKGRVFAPDGKHLHHRLIRAGLSTRGAVGFLWLTAIAFAATACLIRNDRGLGFLLLAGLMLVYWQGSRRLRARIAETTPRRNAASTPDMGLSAAGAAEFGETPRRAA